MNADLDATLNELGPEYRELVSRMRSPFEERRRPRLGWFVGGLAAASLLVFFCFSCYFRDGSEVAPRVFTVRATDANNVFMLAHVKGDEAVMELIRTQRSDGGWDNDFLTRQNAEKLSSVDSPEARLAYRKAVRNLRLRGLK